MNKTVIFGAIAVICFLLAVFTSGLWSISLAGMAWGAFIVLLNEEHLAIRRHDTHRDQNPGS